MSEINPNHIKEIKAKYFNRITEVIADHSDKFYSYEDKYFDIKNLSIECDAEINKYKLRKRRSKC